MFKNNLSTFLKSYMALFFMCGHCVVSAQVLYVNANATGANSGATWADAYTDLQSALDVATSGATIVVAKGKYLPSKEFDFDGSGGSNPQEVTFQIPDGVKLYGGFVGNESNPTDQSTLDARNLKLNTTTLSGDLNGDDIFNKPAGEDTFPFPEIEFYTENAYHVVYTKNVTNTVIDGISIESGYARGFEVSTNPTNRLGAGIYNDGSGTGGNSVLILNKVSIFKCFGNVGVALYNNGKEGNAGAIMTDCEIVFNASVAGAICNEVSSGRGTAQYTNCLFADNVAFQDGGAIYNVATGSLGFDPTYQNCIFRDNKSIDSGGAIYHQALGGLTKPLYYNCTFEGNKGDFGAAVLDIASGVSDDFISTFVGCIFVKNEAIVQGGAYHVDKSKASFINCTIIENSAVQGGGGISLSSGSFAEVRNSIFWNNEGGQGKSSFNLGDSLEISYSMIEETEEEVEADQSFQQLVKFGDNVFYNIDPLFVDQNGGDYSLQEFSVGVDRGLSSVVPSNVTNDLNGNARIQGNSVDIGALESSFVFVISATNSLDDIRVKLYPNPTSEVLKVEGLTKKTSYQLLNNRGQVVLSGQGHNNFELNLSNLPIGIYTLSLENKGKKVNKKLLKK